MRIKCENCGKKFEVPAKHVGKKFPCVKCGDFVRTANKKPDLATNKTVHESKGLAVSAPVFDRRPRESDAGYQFEDDRPRMAIPFLGMMIFVVGILALLFAMAYIYFERSGLEP